MIYKASLNGVAVSCLYLSYRYIDDMKMFTLCMIMLTLSIIKLYQIDKFT